MEAMKTYEIGVWITDAGVNPAEKLSAAGAEILSTAALKKTREGELTVFETRMEPTLAAKIPALFKNAAGVSRIGIFEKIPRAEPAYHAPRPRPEAVRGAPAPEVKMEELEKKLEEILHESR